MANTTNFKNRGEFAKLLSVELTGADYIEGMEIIEDRLLKGDAMLIGSTDCPGIRRNNPYPYRIETLFTPLEYGGGLESFFKKENILYKYGISDIYFVALINPSNMELKRFMEDYCDIEVEEDWDNEEDDVDEELLFDACEQIVGGFIEQDYEEVLSYFSDVKYEWEIHVEPEDKDAEHGYYLKGEYKLLG